MLIRAAQGDREARQQAVATMKLWWESMPQQTRNKIDFKVEAWQRAHPNASPTAANTRRVDMLLAKVTTRARSCRMSILSVAS